jgi:hypothetical protein
MSPTCDGFGTWFDGILWAWYNAAVWPLQLWGLAWIFSTLRARVWHASRLAGV